MKLLVTGGAGFIGTNFVYHMAAQGHDIIVLDKLTYAGGKDNLTSLGEQVTLIIGDIGDAVAVNKAIEGVDWVAHFAAETHNTRSETDPDLFYRTNVDGTRQLLKAARLAKVKRFVHVSTDEVYGSTTSGAFKEEDKQVGDSQATSAYSRSKSLADDMAMAAGRSGTPVIVARPTNNFGPWQFPEKALPRWITNVLLGDKIPLWGEGLQVRDWLFVDSTVKAIDFLFQQGQISQAYNIAANHKPEITNKQAAELVCRILNKDPQSTITYMPDPRPNHDFRYALDTAKLERLGWRPEVDFARQLKRTVAWYQGHEDWWRKRKAVAEGIYQTP